MVLADFQKAWATRFERTHIEVNPVKVVTYIVLEKSGSSSVPPNTFTLTFLERQGRYESADTLYTDFLGTAFGVASHIGREPTRNIDLD